MSTTPSKADTPAGRATRKTRAVKPPTLPAKPTLTNLEFAGDRVKVYSLHTLLTNKKSPETRDTAKLGDVLIPWFEKMVEKPAAKLEGISGVWAEHVPETLQKRARLVGFQRGVLTVAMDSSTTRVELDTQLRSGLLRTLQQHARGTLFKIKTCVQSDASSGSH